MDVSHTNISKRLKKLREAGIISTISENKEKPYDPAIIEQIASNGRAEQIKPIE